MALSHALLFLLLLPSLQALPSPSPSPSPQYTQTLKTIIDLACSESINPEACFSHFETECEHEGPVSIINTAVKATISKAQRAIELLSRFSTLSSNLREQTAIRDCMELLDYSVDELGLSLNEMSKVKKSIHQEEDMTTWLSAALGNQDTCLEGFEGTNGYVKNSIQGSLKQVSQLVSNVLAMIHNMHSLPLKPPGSSAGERYFPAWMVPEEEEIFRAGAGAVHTDAVVALDGSGHFRSVMEAVLAAPDHSERRHVIYVKRGVYRENVELKKKKMNIMLLGDGIGVTVISGSRNFLQGWTTFRTATFAVSGKGFIARGITFRNTAGPENHQAVAIRVDSDQSAFFQCSFEGYQDTLYSHSLRQFYRECNIYGTIDFIFGNGAAVFQNCKIFPRKPLPNQKITITAHGRKDPNQNTGFSIQNSYVYPAPDLVPYVKSIPAYLGRPWKPYSRTVFMESYLGGLVSPEGWLEWYGDFALKTLYYGEFRNYGPGAGVSGRVRWPGYHVIGNQAEADEFTVRRFIDGQTWLPATGISFSLGLTR